MQKLPFVLLKQLQKLLWIVYILLFLVDCEHTCTHFQHSFLIDKCSCKMENILPSDIFNFSVISRSFNLQSAKISLLSFLFSRTTAEFGSPEHSTSFVSVRLHLKSAYHLLTVVSNGAKSGQNLSSHCFT